jgi:CDP-diglyceride synthetase
METLDKIFAYSYYRINQLWLKWGFNQEAQIIAILAMYQTFIILFVWLLVYTTFFINLSVYKMPNYIYYSVGLLYFLLAYINDKRYRKNYFIYVSNWKNEPYKRRRLRGFILIFFFILIPFINGIYLFVFGL